MSKQLPNLAFAITLTTGDYSRLIFIQKNYFKLASLIEKYRNDFEEICFCLEILDKTYKETKMHYHGYIVVKIDKIAIFNRFLTNYNDVFCKFIDVKILTDKEKWIQYMNKQREIIDYSYASFAPYRVIEKTSKIELKQKQKFEFMKKINSLTKII